MHSSPVQSHLSDGNQGVRFVESGVHQLQICRSAWEMRCLELLLASCWLMCRGAWIRFRAEIDWTKWRRSTSPECLGLRSYMAVLCVDAWCVREDNTGLCEMDMEEFARCGDQGNVSWSSKVYTEFWGCVGLHGYSWKAQEMS